MDNNTGGRRWAWGITGAYVVFAGMTLTMVGVAFSQRTDLVSPDYYQQEIDYQRHIDRLARTRSLPEGIAWTLAREEGVLVLKFPRGHFDDGPSGIVSLYRAADAALDQHHTIGLDESGRQRIAVAGLATGRWHIRIEWQADGQQYFSEGALTVGT